MTTTITHWADGAGYDGTSQGNLAYAEFGAIPASFRAIDLMK